MNGECKITYFNIGMIKFMNCEDGMVVYNVRWSSEQVEHKGYVNDQKLEKECGVYLKSGQCVRCSGLM